MDTALAKKIWTEKERMSLPDNGNKYELINGELTMVPTGIEHEYVGATLLAALKRHVSEYKLGIVCRYTMTPSFSMFLSAFSAPSAVNYYIFYLITESGGFSIR